MERDRIVVIKSWVEMVGYLSTGTDVAVKDLTDGECFWIDNNWASWIMHNELFQEGYQFYAQV